MQNLEFINEITKKQQKRSKHTTELVRNEWRARAEFQEQNQRSSSDIYKKMSKVAPKTPENDTTKVCEMYKK